MGKSKKPVDDWQDVPLEQEASAADDWQDLPVERPEPKAAVGDSAIMGAVEGTPLGGWVDEVAGGVEALGSLAGVRGLGGSFDDIHRATDEEQEEGFGDIYEKARDAKRAAYQKAQDDNPGAYLGGQIAGGLASAAVPAGSVASLSKAQKLASIAGAGGLSAAGFSEANPFESAEQLGEFATDVAGGAALGVGTQLGIDKAAPLVAKAAKSVPDGLKNFAERRAFKAAVGNQGKAYDEAVRKGVVNDVGRELLDEGVVTFGSTARKISDRAEDARKATGKEIDKLLGQIDADTAASKVTDPQSAFFRDIFTKTKAQELPFSVKGSDIASKINAYADEITSPANKSIVANLRAQAQEFEEMGQIGLEEAQRLKNLYKWDARDPAAMPIGKEATNALKMIIGDELEGAVGRYAQAAQSKAVPAEQFATSLKTGSGRSVAGPSADGPVLKVAEAAGDGFDGSKADELYKQLKAKYGTMASTAKNAEKNANRFEKNRSISLSDMLMGGFGGVATGNPLTGMAVGAVNNQLRKRGSSMAAVGADKLADVLVSAPETFGRFAPQLQEAAKRGNHALAVTHFLLMQNDPEYRDTVQPQE